MIPRFKPGKKKCKNCPNFFDKKISRPFDDTCSSKCKIEYHKKEHSKTESKIYNKVKKVSSSDHAIGLKRLEDEINAIARLIDFDQPCISCNASDSPQAGHFHSVGSDATLRYNLHNIHVQNYECNIDKGGNQSEYYDGLSNIYNLNYADYIKYGLKNIYSKPLKLSSPQIKTIISLAKKTRKDLETNTRRFSIIERIMLRDKINSELGMYTVIYLK